MSMLIHVGLTPDQVRSFELPSSPLSEKDKRKARWVERMGVEQTEVDSLLALHPGALARMVREALAPYFDPTLDERVRAAERAWGTEARNVISENIAAVPDLADRMAEIEARASDISARIEALETQAERIQGICRGDQRRGRDAQSRDRRHQRRASGAYGRDRSRPAGRSRGRPSGPPDRWTEHGAVGGVELDRGDTTPEGAKGLRKQRRGLIAPHRGAVKEEKMGVDLIGIHRSYNWQGWRELYALGVAFGWQPAGTLIPKNPTTGMPEPPESGLGVYPPDDDPGERGGYFNNDLFWVSNPDATAWAKALYKALASEANKNAARRSSISPTQRSKNGFAISLTPPHDTASASYEAESEAGREVSADNVADRGNTGFSKQRKKCRLTRGFFRLHRAKRALQAEVGAAIRIGRGPKTDNESEVGGSRLFDQGPAKGRDAFCCWRSAGCRLPTPFADIIHRPLRRSKPPIAAAPAHRRAYFPNTNPRNCAPTTDRPCDRWL